MKLGVISVRGEDYHPNRRLGEAARLLGHQLVFLHPFRTWSAIVGGGAGLLSQGALPEMDVVLPRVGSTLSDYSLSLIRQLELMGYPVVNRAAAIELARHQYLTLQALAGAGLPVPDTVLVNRPQGWAAAVEKLGGYPLVLKLVSGRQGRGVALLAGPEEAAKAQALLLHQRRGLILQRYYPPEERRDLRVMVIGGQAVAGMALKPPAGEFRGNVHLGGQVTNLAPEGEPARLAVAAAHALGLEVAGVDILETGEGLRLLEMNYSPGFKGLEEASGLDVAAGLVQYAASRLTPNASGDA